MAGWKLNNKHNPRAGLESCMAPFSTDSTWLHFNQKRVGVRGPRGEFSLQPVYPRGEFSPQQEYRIFTKMTKKSG